MQEVRMDKLYNSDGEKSILSLVFIFFKQKTAYEVRISDWSSDVCSSDLVRAFDDLAISIAFDEEPSGQTSHPGSRATSWLLKGDHLTDPAMAGAQTVEHWFSLAGLEVERCAAAQLIVALGDSITDGRGSTTNGNDRWTDNIARRLTAAPATRHLAIVPQGIDRKSTRLNSSH